jgi:hypothetical protein
MLNYILTSSLYSKTWLHRKNFQRKVRNPAATAFPSQLRYSTTQ